MEDYRNTVINYMQLNPRLSANLPVKLTRMKVRGAIGGGPTSLLATVVAPLWGGHGPMGRLHWPGPLAMGAMGTNPMGRWPKAHWPPLGGRIQAWEKARRGLRPPMAPPIYT